MTALEARALVDTWAASLAVGGDGLANEEFEALVSWVRLELADVEPAARAATLGAALGPGSDENVVCELLLEVAVPEPVVFVGHTVVVVKGGLVDRRLAAGGMWHHEGADWRSVEEPGELPSGQRVWRIELGSLPRRTN